MQQKDSQIVPENWDTGVCASILFGFWYNGATQVFRPGNVMLSWAYWRFVFFPPHLNCTAAVGVSSARRGAKELGCWWVHLYFSSGVRSTRRNNCFG